MSGFASCCLLSFERQSFVADAILTMTGNAGYPMELLVHDDGSKDPDLRDMLRRFVDAGTISTLIENPPGHNQGVGLATRRMFDMAQGDPIIKIDQDLIFQPNWLKEVVSILERNSAYDGSGGPEIGALGLFKYHAPPVVHSEMEIQSWGDWIQVKDFVGSAMVVTREVYEDHGPFPMHSEAFAEDVAFKERLVKAGYALGVTVDDLVVNRGFGLGPSTVAVDDGSGNPTARPIHHVPRVLDAPQLRGYPKQGGE